MKTKDLRIEWVDIARAVTMFYVIIGHITPGGDIHTFMYSFHVPAFFFLSGMFVTGKDSFLKHTFRRFKNIMVPYYFFGAAAIAAYLLLGHLIPQSSMLTLRQCLYGLVAGSAKTDCMKFNLHLWFLPALFVMNIIIYPLRRIADKLEKSGRIRARTVMCIFTLVSVAVSVSLVSYQPVVFLPLGADTAIRLFPFFVAGNAVRGFECIMNPRKKTAKSAALYFAVSAVMFALTAVFAKLNEMKTSEDFHVNYFRDHYGNHLLFWAAAVCGIIAVVSVSKLIPPVKPLTYVGEKTLAILVMQKFPIMLFNSVIPFTAGLIRSENLPAVIILSVVIAICCLAADYVIVKLFPFAYGRSYKKAK